MRLQSERVVLRHFRAGDTDNVLSLDGDAEVMRYLDRTRSRAEIADWVTGSAGEPGDWATRLR